MKYEPLEDEKTGRWFWFREPPGIVTTRDSSDLPAALFAKLSNAPAGPDYVAYPTREAAMEALAVAMAKAKQ
jgi:hypothetical protein